MDDRVKLLIERIEKFPEEFETLNGEFTHLKWLLWFKSHFEHLTKEEKSAVSNALAKVHRESALCKIVTTITDECDTRALQPNGLLGSGVLGSADPKHLVISPSVAKMFKGSAIL